jgi:hypothetical protein
LSARSYLGTAAAAALLAAVPLVAFLTTNQYPLASPEAGLLLAACAAGGALLGLSALLGASAAALALGAAAVLSLDLLFGLHASKAALVLVPLACLILRRHIALVITAAFSVLFATTAFARSEPPVMLHIVLDEHIGLDGIPRGIAGGADFERWLAGSWLDAGFRIHAGAYSQYADTRNSLANLLNFSSSADDWAHFDAGRSKPYVLARSAYFRHLAARGYRLNVYQSDYMDFCRVPGVPYASCFSYRANSVGALPGTSLGTVERVRLIFNSFLSTSSYLNRLRAIVGYHAVNRVGPIPVLRALERLEQDLRRASPGQAYFAHLLIPHYPYVLDESCRIRERVGDWLYNVVEKDAPVPNSADSRAERYRRYFAQIRCQQRLLRRLFDALEQAGVWRDAQVIVHGDHGSRIARRLPVSENAGRLSPEDFRDYFSTLFAVRMPGTQAEVRRGPRSLQELLREVLGLPAQRSPALVYLRTRDGGDLIPLPRDTGPAPR